jgi:hypothetical protein
MHGAAFRTTDARLSAAPGATWEIELMGQTPDW